METHNVVERKVEEILKHQPFMAGDVESAVHGEGHVHEEKDHGGEQAGVGDVEAVVQGKDVLDSHRKEEEAKVSPLNTKI